MRKWIAALLIGTMVLTAGCGQKGADQGAAGHGVVSTGEQKVEDDGQIQKGNMRQIFQKFPVLFLLDQPENHIGTQPGGIGKETRIRAVPADIAVEGQNLIGQRGQGTGGKT